MVDVASENRFDACILGAFEEPAKRERTACAMALSLNLHFSENGQFNVWTIWLDGRQ